MILVIPDSLFINRNIRPKDNVLPVEAWRDDDDIWFRGLDGGVEINLSIDELRAIMRLFDVAESEE